MIPHERAGEPTVRPAAEKARAWNELYRPSRSRGCARVWLDEQMEGAARGKGGKINETYIERPDCSPLRPSIHQYAANQSPSSIHHHRESADTASATAPGSICCGDGGGGGDDGWCRGA